MRERLGASSRCSTRPSPRATPPATEPMKRLLLVDDEEGLVDLLKEHFEKEYEIVTVVSGRRRRRALRAPAAGRRVPGHQHAGRDRDRRPQALPPDRRRRAGHHDDGQQGQQDGRGMPGRTVPSRMFPSRSISSTWTTWPHSRSRRGALRADRWHLRCSPLAPREDVMKHLRWLIVVVALALPVRAWSPPASRRTSRGRIPRAGGSGLADRTPGGQRAIDGDRQGGVDLGHDVTLFASADAADPRGWCRSGTRRCGSTRIR